MADTHKEPDRIRGRLLRLSLAVLLGLDLFIGFDLWFGRETQLEAARNSTRGLTRSMAEHATRSFAGIDQLLSGMGEVLRERMAHQPDGQLEPGDPEVTALLRRRIALNPYIRAFTVLDEQGAVIADSRSNASLQISLADRPYFRVHAERPSHQMFIGEPAISRIDDRWFFSASVTLFNPEGGFAGIINAVVDPDYLYNFFISIDADAAIRLTLLNERGIVFLMRPDQDQSLGTTIADTALFTIHLHQASSGLFEDADRGGIPSVIAFQRIAGYPMVVTAAMPLTSALASWHRHLASSLAAALVLNLALLGLMVQVTRRFLQDGQLIRSLRVSENAAVASQIQLSDAIESMTEGFMLFDRNERIIMFNSRYRRMLGHVGDQLRTGMSYEELLRTVAESGVVAGSGEDPEPWIRTRLDLHRNPAGPVEQQLTSGRWLLAWVYPTRDGGRVHIRTDITFLKQQQLELSRQGLLLRTTVENILQGVCVFDRDARLVLWNRNWLNLLRLPDRFGQVGTRLEDVLNWRAQRGDYGSGDVDLIVARRMADVEGLEDHNDERSLPDGRVVEVRGVLMPGGGRLTTYTDVTQRKLVEIALRQKTEVLETTLESMDQGISLFDRDLLLIAANRRYFELMDYPPNLSQLGTPFDRFLRYSAERGEFGDGDAEIELQKQLAAVRSPLQTTFEHVRHDGIVIEIRSRPIAQGGCVRTHTDITERKRYENELQDAKSAAERTSEIKSLFLAKMSHELRTPFNAIIGFADIIAKKSFGDSQEAVDTYASYADEIRHSGQHLLDLVNNILDISKIESGRMTVMIDRFDLHQVLNSSMGMMRELARSQDVSIVLDLPEVLPEARADERAVKQIVTNLLSNALKFTPQGGTITIGVTVHPDNAFEISVTDTGVGIPLDQIERILLPFEQGDNRYSRSAGGTGLGLALVKGLVELHGGELRIASTVGVGTRISVYFPASSGDLNG